VWGQCSDVETVTLVVAVLPDCDPCREAGVMDVGDAVIRACPSNSTSSEVKQLSVAAARLEVPPASEDL